MGHHELGRLSGSRKWRQVIALISGGADVQDVAAATSAAAENQMIDAGNDPAVKRAVWLLTQIPIAARQEDFASELRKLGLNVSDRPSYPSGGRDDGSCRPTCGTSRWAHGSR